MIAKCHLTDLIVKIKRIGIRKRGISYDMGEMTEFYLVLLKIKKNRPKFDIELVMTEIYTEKVFQDFLEKFANLESKLN